MGGHGDLEGLGFCFSLVICNLYLPRGTCCYLAVVVYFACFCVAEQFRCFKGAKESCEDLLLETRDPENEVPHAWADWKEALLLVSHLFVLLCILVRACVRACASRQFTPLVIQRQWPRKKPSRRHET